MAYAKGADVEARLRRDLTTDEADHVEDLLNEASALVRGYLGGEPDPDDYDETTDAIVIVTSQMVARVFREEDSGSAVFAASQTSQVAGPYSQQLTFQQGANTGGPWLDGKDKIMLRPYRVSGGMSAVSLGSDQRGTYRHKRRISGA